MGVDNISSGKTRLEILRLYVLIQLEMGKYPGDALGKLNQLERIQWKSDPSD